MPAGVAEIDITPDYPIRMTGYGGRKTESEGTEQRLKARALAIAGDARRCRRVRRARHGRQLRRPRDT